MSWSNFLDLPRVFCCQYANRKLLGSHPSIRNFQNGHLDGVPTTAGFCGFTNHGYQTCIYDLGSSKHPADPETPRFFCGEMGGVGWDSTATNALGVFLYGKHCDATHPIERLQTNLNKNGCNCPKKNHAHITKWGFPIETLAGTMGGASSFLAMMAITGFLSATWTASRLSKAVGVSDIVLVIATGDVGSGTAHQCSGFKTFISYIIMEWFCNYDASMMEHG